MSTKYKKRKYNPNQKYRMIITYDERDKIYVVRFPALNGCMAHGKTVAEAVRLAEKIKREWIKEANKW